jgi:predicted SprT family Zn-dependent metalloprotease
MKEQGRGGVIPHVPDWRQLLLNWSFPCPRCRQIGLIRSEEEFHYECRHCAAIFDIRDPAGALNTLQPVGNAT